MDTDKLLASADQHPQSACTPPQWQEIARLALQRFSAFLELPIVHERFEDEDFVGGFSVSIYGGNPARGAHLRTTWRGILGADISEMCGIQVSATIFVYSDGKRLVARSGGDYLQYRYERSSSGEYHWAAPEWEMDEHDEYGFFDQEFLDVPDLEVVSPSPLYLRDPSRR